MRLLSPLIVLFALLPVALAAQAATPVKSEVYVVPFSHLDLFWGGTREECLSRGNRIIVQNQEPICAGIIAGGSLMGILTKVIETFFLK